jgi:hypothetical protein
VTPRFADLAAPARDLGESTLAWADQWFDPDVALVWNPDDAFEETPKGRQLHMVPQSAWYAFGLLLRDRGDDRATAVRVIEAVLDTQYDAPGTAWDGTFARFRDWPDPPPDARIWVDYDPNWRQFVGTTFLLMLAHFESVLSEGLVRRMDHSIGRAVAGEDPGRVTASYSNIALMKAWLEVEHGARSGSPEIAAAGQALAASVVEHFDRHGSFEEYNSPTYYGIDFYALRLWRTQSSSASLRDWGARLEAAVWDDVARFFHPELANLCGPWTRSYGMDMGRYVGAMSLWMWAALGREHTPLPALTRPFEHGHDLLLGACAAFLGADLPDGAATRLTELGDERFVERVVSSDPHRVATAWLEPGLMLGAEASEPGWPAWGQLHPVTLHWRRPDGGIGWLRLRHRAPVSATVTRRALSATCRPHPRHGPQTTTIEIHAPGAGPDAFGDGRWQLPGLVVEVEASADVVDVRGEGEVVIVRYQAVDHDASWRLRVVEAPGSSAPETRSR